MASDNFGMAQVGKLEGQAKLGGLMRTAAKEAAGDNEIISHDEQGKLPEFLQRMAEGVRKEKGAHARVMVDDVVDRGMSIAMRTIAKEQGANPRDKATWGAAEMAALAKKDPALGELATKAYLAAKAAHAAGGGGDAGDAPAFHVDQLAENDPLRVKAEDQHSTWRDEDIDFGGGVVLSTGKLVLENGAAPSEAELKSIALEMFTKALEEEDETTLVAGTPVSYRSPAYADAIKDTGFHISEDGFGYAPENREGRSANAKDTAAVLKKLGPAEQIAVMIVAGTKDDQIGGEPVDASFHLYLNKETGKMASFYVSA